MWRSRTVRWLVTALTVNVLACGALPGTASFARESSTPVAGTFNVGDSLAAGIDERTGVFRSSFLLTSLPGITGLGGTNLTLSYDHERAASGFDHFGLGAGWGWDVTVIETGDGVRVYTPLGDVLEADASHPAGLARYPGFDLFFSAQNGILPARAGADPVAFAFVMEYLGGITEYFTSDGDLAARTDRFGNRIDWSWGPGHRLLSITDAAGNVATLSWMPHTVTVTLPTRSDTITPVVTTERDQQGITRLTDANGEHTNMFYSSHDLLERVRNSQGATTQISYQPLGPDNLAVNIVRITDETGHEVLRREWTVVGEYHPQKSGHNVDRWSWGGRVYRYETQLSDGVTKLINEYNGRHMQTSKRVITHTAHGDVTREEHTFHYVETHDDAASESARGSINDNKPVRTDVTYRDAHGNARTVTDETEYDTAGRITRQVSGDGTVTQTRYDTHIPAGRNLPLGLIVERTLTAVDGSISHVAYTLADDHKSATIIEASVGTLQEQLRVASRVEAETAADGFVREERLVETREHSAQVKQIATRFERSEDIDAGLVTVQRIHAAGDAASSTTSVIYDRASGLTVQSIDETGNHHKSGFDAGGRVVTRESPDGQITATEYGTHFTRVTDARGVTITRYLDVLGRHVKTTDNLHVREGRGRSIDLAPTTGVERVRETLDYDNNRVTRVDERGNTTVAVTDLFGRPVTVDSATGLGTVREYDDVRGSVREALTPTPQNGFRDALAVVDRHHDNHGRDVRVSETRSDSRPVPDTTQIFDGLGRTTNATAGNIRTNTSFNPDGTPAVVTTRPVSPDSCAAETVTATRNHTMTGQPTHKVLSRPSRSCDSEPPELEKAPGVSHELDAAGRVTRESDQKGDAITYRYTLDGLVAERHEESSGVTTRHRYDPATRALTLTETTGPGEARVTAFDYDPLTGDRLAVFDPNDRAHTHLTYAYDIYGNTTEKRYPDGKTLSHDYDEFGRKTSDTDVLGNVTRYTYDHRDLLARARQESPNGDLIALVEYDYDAFGRLTDIRQGNGTTTQYTYTSHNEIETEHTTTREGHTLFSGSYEYDSVGNLTRKTMRQRHATEDAINEWESAGEISQTVTYHYDAYDQLVASHVFTMENSEGEPDTSTYYDVDLAGNITRQTVTSGEKQNIRELEHNDRGHTTTVTNDRIRVEQAYDSAGNLIHAANGSVYRYNLNNQVVKETLTDGTEISTNYWADGQPKDVTTLKPSSAAPESHTTQFYWDENGLSNEVFTGTLWNTSAAVPTVASSYLRGVKRHTRSLDSTTGSSAVPATTTEYYISDRHGNVTHTTDNAGSPTTSYEYDDYGRTTTHSTSRTPAGAHRNPYQYAGEYTTQTQMQRLGSRIYDPETLSFTTKDTADQFNLYAFAHANPITKIDPTGQTPENDSVSHSSGINVLSVALGIALSLPTGGASWLSAGVGITALTGDVLSAVAASRSATEQQQAVTTTGSVLATAGAVFLGVAGILTIATANRSLTFAKGFKEIDDQAQIIDATAVLRRTLQGLSRARQKLEESLGDLARTAEEGRAFNFSAWETMLEVHIMLQNPRGVSNAVRTVVTQHNELARSMLDTSARMGEVGATSHLVHDAHMELSAFVRSFEGNSARSPARFADYRSELGIMAHTTVGDAQTALAGTAQAFSAASQRLNVVRADVLRPLGDSARRVRKVAKETGWFKRTKM